MNNNFNKIVIVTGASRGIGADIVKKLATNGYTVILNYNKSIQKAEEVKQELEKRGYIIDTYKADVSKKTEAESLIKYAIEKYGRVDVLINNAGIAQNKLFTEITDEDWNRMIDNNLNSAFYCTRAVVKEMLKSKSGVIINISSIWGITGGSCEVHYSTSKAGLIGFTKALAKELRSLKYKSKCYCPRHY